jgi:hypothetical protein
LILITWGRPPSAVREIDRLSLAETLRSASWDLIDRDAVKAAEFHSAQPAGRPFEFVISSAARNLRFLGAGKNRFFAAPLLRMTILDSVSTCAEFHSAWTAEAAVPTQLLSLPNFHSPEPSSAPHTPSANTSGLRPERLECCRWSAALAGIRWWHARAAR